MLKSSIVKIVKPAFVAALLISGGVTSPLLADSLTVSPTRLNVKAASQTTLTVKASGKQASVLQMRVLKWREGTDPKKAKPTRDVIVSPPVARLNPRQELTVRLVRVSKRPVRGRECYRVLVDRLPGKEQSGQAVKLQVRHSVPMCFSS
ncbi:fimbria/pilus periplasmic chaperone [Lentibacter algarum]|uniref:fimbrial biogenesis chaperone n=1 Tax=Lentibacter algarum TaxID=576131 RepID=UPI001C08D650|nr:fimbria/pilus periplasmic chaperone [Lentibacter algarum]MBU2983078.1 fimbria/pilus periplasmic chaperone [Lentibacter algarum]